MTNALKIIVSGLAMLATVSLAFTQGFGGKPLPPELKAKYDQSGACIRAAKKSFSEGRHDEAAGQLRQAIAIEGELPGFFGDAYYELAKELVARGRDSQAVDAFRHAFMWSERDQDIITNGPAPEDAICDYANALTRLGRLREAKAMYYVGARLLWRDFEDCNTATAPVPFIVTFDPDPSGTAWDLSIDNLTVALDAIRAARKQNYAAMLDVHRRKPDWFWPALYLANMFEPTADATSTSTANRLRFLREADQAANSAVERQLMAAYRDFTAEGPSKSRGAGSKRESPVSKPPSMAPDVNELKRLSVAGRV